MTDTESSNPTPLFDAFLSHSSEDHDRAEEIRDFLEDEGLRCWIAPRDIDPGLEYGEAIVSGIRSSRCLVLVLSNAANASPMVRREVERAVSLNKPVFPVRVEEVMPARSLEFFVSATHWIDAWRGAFDRHLAELANRLRNDHLLEDVAATMNQRRRRRSLMKRVKLSSASIAILALTITILTLLLQDQQDAPLEDPILSMAEAEGIHPEDIGAEDFSLAVTRNYGMRQIRVVPSARVEPFVSQGYVGFRIGNRHWKQLYTDGQSRYYGQLDDNDFKESGPLEFRLGSTNMWVDIKNYPSFEMDLDIQAGLEGADLQWLANQDNWARHSSSRGWELQERSLAHLMGDLKRIEVGARNNSAELEAEVVARTANESGELDWDETYRDSIESLNRELRQKWSPDRTLHVRFHLTSGTVSPTILLTPPKGTPRSPEHLAFDNASEARVDLASLAEPVVSLSGRQLRFLRSIDPYLPFLTEIKVRGQYTEASRIISVVDCGKVGEPADNVQDFYLCYREGRGHQSYLQVPPHWGSANLELHFKDGEIIEVSADNDREPDHRGFLATAVGNNRSEAPTVFVIHKGRGQFGLTPWHSFPWNIEDHPSLPSTPLRHPEDRFTLAFRNLETGLDSIFEYEMAGIVELEDELPFSVRIDRIESEVVVSGDFPITGIKSTESGAFLLLCRASDQVEVLRIEDGKTVGSVSSGFSGDARSRNSPNRMALAPDASTMVLWYFRDKEYRPPQGGAWGLFDTATGKHIVDLVYPEGGDASSSGVPHYTPDGKFIFFRDQVQRYKSDYAPAQEGTLQRPHGIWAAADGQPILGPTDDLYRLLGIDPSSQALFLSRDGKRLHTISLNSSSAPLLSKELKSSATRATLAPDGRHVAVFLEQEQTVQALRCSDLVITMEGYSRSGQIPQFHADGEAVLTRPHLDSRWFELLAVDNGEALFRAEHRNDICLTPELVWRGEEVPWKERMQRTLTGEALSHIPYPYYGGRGKQTHLPKATSDYLIWVRDRVTTDDVQRVYFIDLHSPKTSQLMIGPGMHVDWIEVAAKGQVVFALRSDGKVITWRPRG